ncbi:hypothetical protein E2F50_20610 [Rhizobium deserti]|uniref:Uncharacterized protein n=1 Tax=Rhizobium deserti TaxID=2547961 RepID=A0A4R5U9M8_9HYPH|nr:hypothetical protein [Rhizobium deserti]TDK31340.1 hypothetical protein E2F50_20610 [Rhizobium deserti]
MSREKLTDGLNDRAKDAAIGQTAAGIPDDSGPPVEVDEKTFKAMAEKLLADRSKDEKPEN